MPSLATLDPQAEAQQRQAAIDRADQAGFYSLQKVTEEKRLSLSRLTTVLQYCQGGIEMAQQVDAGREPYLLIESDLNPGVYMPVEIYDTPFVYLDDATGRCWLDLKTRAVLVEPGTVVYWC